MLVGGVFPLELIDLAIENLEEISSLVLLVVSLNLNQLNLNKNLCIECTNTYTCSYDLQIGLE